jgi:hypothetical protein
LVFPNMIVASTMFVAPVLTISPKIYRFQPYGTICYGAV